MFARILDFVFPPQCAVCDRVGSGLCSQCAPSPDAAHRFDLDGLPVFAVGEYDGALRTAVLAIKGGRRNVAAALADLIVVRFAGLLNAGVALVPVPTTRARRAVRGFDQAELIARRVATLSSCTLVQALAQSRGRAQHGRSRAERLAANGRFAVISREQLESRRVLLLDDVVTTGATLHDAASALAKGGTSVIGACVVARTDVDRAHRHANADITAPLRANADDTTHSSTPPFRKSRRALV